MSEQSSQKVRPEYFETPPFEIVQRLFRVRGCAFAVYLLLCADSCDENGKFTDGLVFVDYMNLAIRLKRKPGTIRKAIKALLGNGAIEPIPGKNAFRVVTA